ncbi:hypothetical protein M5K25_022894 [Dendrobium thyrsiflorum]|uniref:Uncharacterized protein n=1 Tax=Dendrobium thyrsiflorum TaxID=117978 RepID=A0ABD0U740_DENTH
MKAAGRRLWLRTRGRVDLLRRREDDTCEREGCDWRLRTRGTAANVKTSCCPANRKYSNFSGRCQEKIIDVKAAAAAEDVKAAAAAAVAPADKALLIDVLGKGVLPASQPVVVKVKLISKIAEKKMKANGGAATPEPLLLLVLLICVLFNHCCFGDFGVLRLGNTQNKYSLSICDSQQLQHDLPLPHPQHSTCDSMPGVERYSTLEIAEQSCPKGSSEPPSYSTSTAIDDSNHRSYRYPTACTCHSSLKRPALTPTFREHFVLDLICSSPRRLDVGSVPYLNPLNDIKFIQLARPPPLPHDQPALTDNSHHTPPSLPADTYKICRHINLHPLLNRRSLYSLWHPKPSKISVRF